MNIVYSHQHQGADTTLLRVLDEGNCIASFEIRKIRSNEGCRMQWHYGVKPAAVENAELYEGAQGIGDEIFVQICQAARELGCDSLHMEILQDDKETADFLVPHFRRMAGELSYDESKEKLRCYETPIDASCPMLPILMRPSYRHGDMTPWGGDGLKTVFGREIPDDRTGEALEISAIEGLESRTDAGETLPELIERNGKMLVGNSDEKQFPLLLKLLCAKQPLSVQVHPDDAYAAVHEHKLGKTEAWVILKAEKDASILYGIKDGVTLDMLREGLESGSDIEPMIERVSVEEGDVYYMPSGMVHAIGSGIVLYEIQQSSDVTYRLWDYNRKNAEGKTRPLHIRQSLDVIDPKLRGQRGKMPEKGGNEMVTLLDVPAFRTDCALVNGELSIKPEKSRFRILTALDSLLVCWKGDAMELLAGDSVLLPAACPRISLKGVGRALLSMPPEK